MAMAATLPTLLERIALNDEANSEPSPEGGGVQKLQLSFQPARCGGPLPDQAAESPEVDATDRAGRHARMASISSVASRRSTADTSALHSVAGKMRELLEMVTDNLHASAPEMTGAESVRASVREDDEDDGFWSNAAIVELEDVVSGFLNQARNSVTFSCTSAVMPTTYASSACSSATPDSSYGLSDSFRLRRLSDPRLDDRDKRIQDQEQEIQRGRQELAQGLVMWNTDMRELKKAQAREIEHLHEVTAVKDQMHELAACMEIQHLQDIGALKAQLRELNGLLIDQEHELTKNNEMIRAQKEELDFIREAMQSCMVRRSGRSMRESLKLMRVALNNKDGDDQEVMAQTTVDEDLEEDTEPVGEERSRELATSVAPQATHGILHQALDASLPKVCHIHVTQLISPRYVVRPCQPPAQPLQVSSLPGTPVIQYRPTKSDAVMFVAGNSQSVSCPSSSADRGTRVVTRSQATRSRAPSMDRSPVLRVNSQPVLFGKATSR